MMGKRKLTESQCKALHGTWIHGHINKFGDYVHGYCRIKKGRF